VTKQEKQETQAQACHQARDPLRIENSENGVCSSLTASDVDAGALERPMLQLRSSANPEVGPEAEEQSVILVAEDDEPIAETVALLLEEAGYLVMWVPNGREALDAVRRLWPSLVLTDLMMPRMGGEALIDALRALAMAEHRPMPPVVLLTATNVTAQQAAKLGAAAVMLKPFDIREVEGLVARLVQNVPSQ